MTPPPGNGRGPPPWAGPDDRVRETDEGVVVDENAADSARRRIKEASTQDDRIEAKLDWIIAQLEDRDGE